MVIASNKPTLTPREVLAIVRRVSRKPVYLVMTETFKGGEGFYNTFDGIHTIHGLLIESDNK